MNPIVCIRRFGITSYGSFDNTNVKLELERDATQLDWIIKQSSHSVLFYDQTQTVRPSDVRKDDFDKLSGRKHFSSYSIKSQLRVLGGEDYIKYVSCILLSIL